ncbi:embigin [Monodelphis domestica]|uniref:Embigin n=1 Tax=Monodelphis domestica TaxID=13616 RepID=F7C1C3_MONDO|nr:embigin [Monodelphis domestica]
MRSSPEVLWAPLSLSFLLYVAGPCFSEGTTTDADFTTEIPTEETISMDKENVTSSTGFYPELISMEASLLVMGTSDVPVEKNVTVGNPANIELKCNFSTTQKPHSMYAVWKKGNDVINRTSNVQVIDNVLQTYIRLMITERMHLGSYSCIIEEANVQKGIFNLEVPVVYTKEKPLVNYERDSVVLYCNTKTYVPSEWIWYSSNGSEKVPIDIDVKDKYEILPSTLNETKIKIKHLKATESGLYWCHAIFPLGESEGKQFLKVLTYLVPLKPFLAVTAEVIILVTGIFLYEHYTKKKQMPSEDGKDFEQSERLKSEDHNGVQKDEHRTRHRKSEASVNFCSN